MWVGRPVRCRAASRAALSVASCDDSPERRDTNSPRRERNDFCGVDAIAPRQDAGEPRARRATHYSGLDVPSDAGRRPAPPCPSQVTTILPRGGTRSYGPARETISVALTPSLPGRMPGSLARDARPTCGWRLWVGRPVRCRRRPAPPCPRQVATILPRGGTRSYGPARETISVALTPSLPGRMPGSLARDARPTCGWRLWVGRPVRCRAASRAALSVASYEDSPERRDTNFPRRERNDFRGVDAIAPRQDAGEPRARRATHYARPTIRDPPCGTHYARPTMRDPLCATHYARPGLALIESCVTRA